VSIRIECVCGARLKAPESSIGKSVRCAACGNAVYVADPALVSAVGGGETPRAKPVRAGVQVANRELTAWIRVTCACGKVIKAPPEWAGKKGACPRCGADLTMPEAAPGPSSAEPAEPARKRPAPVPQPRPQADAELERFSEEQAVRQSGLLDLTGREDVQIVDGVPAAIRDAKLEQRAKALKASPQQKTEYYRNKMTPPTGARAVLNGTRTWLARRPLIPMGASAAVIVLAVTMIVRAYSGPAVPVVPWPTVYCYDLNTGKIFAGRKTAVAPFATDSGSSPVPQPAGVWAAVFACGSCADPANRFVGWVEALTPEARAVVEPLLRDNPDGEPHAGLLENALAGVENSVQLANPRDINSWHAQSSPEAVRLMTEPVGKCKTPGELTRCQP